MNRIAAWYAHALGKILPKARGNEALLAERTIALLREKGHLRIIPALLREFARVTEHERRKRTVIITLAREKERETRREEIGRTLRAEGIESDMPQAYTIDETLVRGFRIRTKDRQIDASAKRALAELYERITANTRE